jgi:hypothetical protein
MGILPSRTLSFERKAEGERGSLSLCAADADLSAVGFHNGLAEIESQPGSFGQALLVGRAVEPIENASLLLFVEAKPFVTDCDVDVGAIVPSRH